ncbi:hypothetical protein [Methylocystis rosea]|uniref:hypothetical protein n=1 Tax=Methylocystis rosea TaxID=173366 RepID=UPI0018DD4F82|nr:hypothetical protein [Methylocystis rosea]
MSNLVHNEQLKMIANLFNNLAVVSLATGALTPLFSGIPYTSKRNANHHPERKGLFC